MILDRVRHQKPGQPGRQTEDRCGTPNGPCRDETWSAGTTDKGSGRGHLLAQALTRETIELGALEPLDDEIAAGHFSGLFDWLRQNVHAVAATVSMPELIRNATGKPLSFEGVSFIRIKDGKIANLQYSRYWAQKQGKRAIGSPGNLLVAGGTKSTAELVAGTQKGILVTRTWYIRMVDPQTVLLTGLTRDGTFYIENGQIKHPVKNFRFNESPVIMLNNIEELGKSVRISGDESPFTMMIPPMKLRDFTFTSLSDAV